MESRGFNDKGLRFLVNHIPQTCQGNGRLVGEFHGQTQFATQRGYVALQGAVFLNSGGDMSAIST